MHLTMHFSICICCPLLGVALLHSFASNLWCYFRSSATPGFPKCFLNFVFSKQLCVTARSKYRSFLLFTLDNRCLDARASRCFDKNSYLLSLLYMTVGEFFLQSFHFESFYSDSLVVRNETITGKSDKPGMSNLKRNWNETRELGSVVTLAWATVNGRPFDDCWSDNVSLVEGVRSAASWLGGAGTKLARVGVPTAVARLSGVGVGRSVRAVSTQRAQRLLQRRSCRTRVNYWLWNIAITLIIALFVMLFTPDKDKEVILYPAFVCLLETSRKTTDRIFANILPEIYLWAGKNWFSFGRHPHLDPDQGIFKHLPTFRDMTFLHNLTYLWKDWSVLHANLYHRHIYGQ